eukprot:TRINITY_DN57076_c0_g1_i1.p1 TRINITY_DN57076_c0_g1~~TRINITY_DN57076_c0_g1_i1.p1  ORF type:complete len:248 (+),score=36.97 TRINITY_DN57076_c0_g1_i1:69-746(+)
MATFQALIVGRGNLGSAVQAKLLERKDVTVRMASRSSDDVKLDVGSLESIRDLDFQLKAQSIDHVAICTGSSTYGPLAKFTAEAWQGNVAGKLLSVSQLVLAIVQDLKFLKDNGSITVTTGQSATTVNKMWPGLAVNNAGLNAFVANAGVDLPRGIRLNACSPCLIAETAEKAGLPMEGTIRAADCADAFLELMFGTMTAVVHVAGEQVAFERKTEGLAKTSDMS